MAKLLEEMPLMEWIERTPKDMRWMVRELFQKKLETAKLEIRMYIQVIKQLDNDISRETTPLMQELENRLREEQAALDASLQDEPPADGHYTRCVCCEAGGDLSEKPCTYRTDTGIKEGWYCAECYAEWKNTP